MKIDGVVVLYKPNDHIYENIESYISELEKLYVVDNTPNADISNTFKENSKIEYIPLKENKGIAYALNVGAQKALENKADYLLTMDQDSHFRKDEFSHMIFYLNSILQGKNSLSLEIDVKKIGIVSPFQITKLSEKMVDVVKGIDFPIEVMTSGNLVNLEAYKNIGGFKDWMFIDCVDFEFCFNMQRNGYKIIRFNEIKLEHPWGTLKKSTPLIKIKKILKNHSTYIDHSPMRLYYIARNGKYLYDMYYDIFPEYCTNLVRCIFKELIKIWLLEDKKIAKTKAIIKGLIDYKRGIKGKVLE